MKCGHRKLVEKRYFDDGVGQPRTLPSAWDIKECAKCGKLVALKACEASDWRLLPSGCENSPYGVIFPNGYCYTS